MGLVALFTKGKSQPVETHDDPPSQKEGTHVERQGCTEEEEPEPTSEEREKARKITPMYFFKTRYIPLKCITQGSGGIVFLAGLTNTIPAPTISDSTLHPMEGTLMQPSSNYPKENFPNKTIGRVIIKKVKPRSKHWPRFIHDVEAKFILNVPYHQNIVQVYEMFIDPKDTRWLHISMEAMSTDLLGLMERRVQKIEEEEKRPFPARTLKSILAQVLCGLEHIHKSGFLHCDIKPENILLSTADTYFKGKRHSSLSEEFVVKIADFGHAQDIRKETDRAKLKHTVGTKGFRSPEMLLGMTESISTSSDIFSFGALAYETATLMPLFNVSPAGSSNMVALQKAEVHLNDLVDVMGTPDELNAFGGKYKPEFGYWKEAVDTSDVIGFELAEKRYKNIAAKLEREGLEGFYKVFKGCIQWKPSSRLTIEQLRELEFFKGTCFSPVEVSDDDQDEDDWVEVGHADVPKEVEESSNDEEKEESEDKQ